MTSLVSNPWVVVAGSLLLAPVVYLLASRARVLGAVIAMIAPLSALALGAASLVRVLDSASTAEPWTSALASQGAVRWFDLAGASFSIGWAVDSLAAIMLCVVGLVASCVVLFSIGYMHGDAGWARYFALLALFTGAMSLLVIGDGFVPLLIGWELVGACSYLLIGFWFTKPSAAAAATKAFLTTRLGDVALMVGLGVIWSATGSLAFEDLAKTIGGAPHAAIAAGAMLVALGAIGKSAQFPLHAWLPDAMEGPTPVSALIHAATMVAAGVYLVARMWPLFEAAPEARMLLLAAGSISAAGAAMAAVAQSDIKKVLAYSTVSQLGFMFAALGLGAWVAAFFHLVTHAAFKALLFLVSGSVIHGTGTQEIAEMGGLRRSMPFTFAAWAVGSLALIGAPPFSGFFSKDAILEAALTEAPIIGVLLLGTAVLTALYVARTTRLAFFGAPAPGLHAHESGASMLVPLAVLAVPATLLGLAAGPFAEALGHEAEHSSPVVSGVAIAAVIVGFAVGWLLFADREKDAEIARTGGATWSFLNAAYRWNSLVDLVVVRPTVALSRGLWAWGDRLVADGAIVGTARIASWTSGWLSRLHSGDAQSYGTVLAVTAALLLAASAWLGR